MDKSCKNQFFGTSIPLVGVVAHRVYCMHVSPYRWFVYLVGGFDANKGLSKWHRSEATVKEKQANIGVDMEEGSHIQIVGQGG